MKTTPDTVSYLEHVARLNERYRAGDVHAHVPEALLDGERTLDALVEQHLPASHAALEAASRGLFFSLPVAFDPAESVGPYLAAVDRDAAGQPYRFLDMGALIATQAFGENDPAVVRAVLESLPFVTTRYAHSEYQTVLSLRLKAELNRIAPAGAPRHFIVNTGAEAVENAIKSVLMNRVMTSPDGDGGFIVSFEGAFHGRTLGALAVTHRKKARLGFPTFDWPHIPFPTEEARSPKETARREERSLKQLWDLLVSGRLPHAEKSKDTYKREMDAIDEFLARTEGSSGASGSTGSSGSGCVDPEAVNAFVEAQRANLAPDVVRRSKRVAAVLVEPIQGEGGVRLASARFMRKLRLLTRIYDVPLIFDEVQTGFGMTGRLWAHELFDLPCPPDVVTWAKKAQNGVLFVSEELATFFQEEKKFNTTWEGDSVGMVRLLALLDKLDLDQIRRTGERARSGLEALAREHREILRNVRGTGVMLAFDVMRADWCEALLDRAFRRGLVLLRAGERSVRFYPRYDTEPSAIDEALSILRLAIEDLGGPACDAVAASSRQPTLRQARTPVALAAATPALPVSGLKTRVGTLAIPLETVEIVDLTPASFEASKLQILTVEHERYGDVQYRAECASGRLAAPAAVPDRDARGDHGESARDRRRSTRPRVGSVHRLCASAARSRTTTRRASAPTRISARTTRSTCRRRPRCRRCRTRWRSRTCCWTRCGSAPLPPGSSILSTLIEDRILETGPAWFRNAAILERIDNYLGSGNGFVYLQVPLRA